MIETSRDMGKLLLDELHRTVKSPIMREIRGRGLYLGLEVRHGDDDCKVTSIDLVHHLRNHGIITSAAREKTCRIMPPLILSKEQTLEIAGKIKLAIEDLEKENASRL